MKLNTINFTIGIILGVSVMLYRHPLAIIIHIIASIGILVWTNSNSRNAICVVNGSSACTPSEGPRLIMIIGDRPALVEHLITLGYKHVKPNVIALNNRRVDSSHSEMVDLLDRDIRVVRSINALNAVEDISWPTLIISREKLGTSFIPEYLRDLVKVVIIETDGDECSVLNEILARSNL